MKEIHPFTQEILNWYGRHGRKLPWRGVSDPYLIWISEIILQQTTVAQGHDYYLRFTSRFPNIRSLAEASQDEVLAVWQGLGYYSRARNLHAAAQSMTDGKFPHTYEGVRALKGVGDYTAAAVCSIAYGLPHAVVDGNVYRVLSRYFGIDTPIDTTAGKRLFAELAQDLLDAHHPAAYNQGIMDFGAIQCVPKSPDCSACPLLSSCRAAELGHIASLPVKSKRTPVSDRYFVYLFVTADSHTYLRCRPAGDIWQGLYEPPLFEFDHQPDESETLAAFRKAFGKHIHKPTCLRKDVNHVLTHRRIHTDFWQAHADKDFTPDGYISVETDELADYPVPKLVVRLLEEVHI